MHLPDSPDSPVKYSVSAAGNQALIVREFFADGACVLTLMGSLSRKLDQGLSIPNVVEAPTKEQQ